jgi:hypothetical protein
MVLAHDPDFTQGIADGRAFFEEVHHGEIIKRAEVQAFIERNLSPQAYERDRAFAQLMGWEDPPTYVHHVGFVIGWLGGLLAAGSQEGEAPRRSQEMHTITVTA